jgi:hypothetical protein
MTNALYRSTTRATSLDALSGPLRDAIVAHASSHQLTLDGARVWLTHSVNPPGEGMIAKLFGRRSNPADADAEHWTCLLIAKSQLVVATHGAARETAVLSVAAANASVRWGATLPAMAMAASANLPQDAGFSITGFAGSEGRPGVMFVKVSDDEAGRECFDAVGQSISESKGG